MLKIIQEKPFLHVIHDAHSIPEKAWFCKLHPCSKVGRKSLDSSFQIVWWGLLTRNMVLKQ